MRRKRYDDLTGMNMLGHRRFRGRLTGMSKVEIQIFSGWICHRDTCLPRSVQKKIRRYTTQGGDVPALADRVIACAVALGGASSA